jgi:DNA-directed RNA polymerase subunit RPC12/RpoP
MHWAWKLWKYLKNEKSEIVIPESYKFPCADDNCLVRAACTKACEKLIMDDDKLKDAFLEYNACPDCGSQNFKEGPSGGMATNVKCAGCGHWFNLALPLFIQRINIDSNGGFRD